MSPTDSLMMETNSYNIFVHRKVDLLANVAQYQLIYEE